MVTNRTQQLERILSRREADLERLQLDIIRLEDSITAGRRTMEEWERAREILVNALLGTQEKLKLFVEDVVTLALSAIYGNECSFELEYVTRRNQVEAIPWIVINGERFSPRDEVGGGVLDIAALALRMAVWAITEPRPAATFLLDEPSKFLSADLQVEFGRMLSELADSLGAQFIVVTHSPAVAEFAGMAYNVDKGSDGISKAERIEI